MKTPLKNCLPLFCLLAGASALRVQAQSGVWTNDASGLWSAALNWTNGVMADGAGSTADFATVNLTADRVVTLDTSRTLGSLRLGDSVGTNGFSAWRLEASGGSILTLSTGTGGSPALVATAGTNVLALPLAGNEGFTKSGGGVVVLTAANPLSGTLNLDSESFFAVNDGAVRVTASGALANVASPIRFRNNTHPDQLGSTLQLDGSAGPVVVAQDFLMNGRNHPSPQIENLAGSNTLSGLVQVNTGGANYLLRSVAGTLHVAGTLSSLAGGTRTYTFQGAGEHVVSGTIENGNATVNVAKTGPGTLRLTGANSFSGTVNLLEGAVEFSTLENLGDPSTTLNFNGGFLRYAPGVTLDLTASKQLTLLGAGGIDTAGNNVAFGGAVPLIGEGGLTKTGAGRLTLDGPAYYNGATRVAVGTLALGAAGSLASTGLVVAAGATLDVTAQSAFVLQAGQTLSGDGTVLGSISDGSGSIINAGTVGTPGTLTFDGALTLSGGGTLAFDLTNAPTAGAGVNDLIVVDGDLTLMAGTAVALNFLKGVPSPGTYTLFQVTGSISGDPASDLVAPVLGNRYTVAFGVDATATPKRVTMTIVGSPQSLTWLGGTDFSWNTTSPNWTNLPSTALDFFSQGDAVAFTDVGDASQPVSLTEAVAPSAVTVNASQDYTFAAGGGSLSGTMGLTKSGTGRLIVETDNTYSGPTVIAGGTLQIGNIFNGGASGTLGTFGTVTNHGTLAFSRDGSSTAFAVPQAITGTGGLVQEGAGTLLVTGSNSFQGLTVVAFGTLNAQTAQSFGTTDAGIVVSNNAQLYIGANVDYGAESLVLSGSGPDGSGALRKGFNGPTTFGGAVTLAEDAIIKLDGGASLNLTNTAGISGVGRALTLAGDGGSFGTVWGPVNLGAATFTKTGGGTWTLMATNTFAGPLPPITGVLRVATDRGFGSVPATLDNAYLPLAAGGGLGAVSNVTLSANRGITLDTTATFDVAGGATFTIPAPISGAATVNKTGNGVLSLAGANSFSGLFYIDTSSTGADQGAVRVAAPGAFPAGITTTYIRNNNGGSSAFQLGGTAGSITVASAFEVSCRNNTNATFQNLAGSNTLSGNVAIFTGGSNVVFRSDAGAINFAGDIQYQGTLTGGRTLSFYGPGDTLLSGNVLASANGATVTPIVYGPGRLVVNGSIQSVGSVRVVGGTLAGSGTISEPVTVFGGGTLAPGDGLGALTINEALTLGGTTRMDVRKTGAAVASDLVAGVTTLTLGGTLEIVLAGDALVAGDSVQLFGAAAVTGAFTAITPAMPGPGLAWDTSRLALDGTLSVVAGSATEPEIGGVTIIGNDIVLSGTGGTPAGGYSVLTHTNVAAPLADWTVLGGGSFNGTGGFSFTNGVSPSVPVRFYLIRVP